MGCLWGAQTNMLQVHRRYREILAFHEQLAAGPLDPQLDCVLRKLYYNACNPGTRGSLPEFPPKALNGLSWMWGEDVPVKIFARN